MYTGRTKILCDETEITAQNVAKVLADALVIHRVNSMECDYLYNYRKGEQPILQRTKEVRPEICNKVVENRADEIVSFKTGYLCGEPLQYVSRGSTDSVSADIGKLNDMMLLCGKSALDKDLAEWMYTCGTGYRMIATNSPYVNSEIIPKLNNRQTDFSEDEAPFEIYTLDPRYTFVVYNSGLGEKPLMAVKYVVQNFGVIGEQVKTVYSVWTNTSYFEITSSTPVVALNTPVAEKKTKLGAIPIIEYPLNNARLGAFEVVLSILDAINTVQSNRVDGVEQFIQSLLVFVNCDIDDDSAKTLRESGLVKIKTTGEIKAEIKELTSALDQQQTQTLINYMYQTVLCIVGMPNRNGGSSTSDTGSAVQLRDGWQGAEARAKTDELSFRESERQFLKAVLRIIRGTVGTSLTLADIDVKFTRRVYENVQSKSQTLISMLNCDKIAPSLAFTHCGLFSDPEDAAKQSAEYYETVKAEQAAQQEKQLEQTASKVGDDVA
jgi:SPP1 family phage portal protein